jgi:hypothetical protein
MFMFQDHQTAQNDEMFRVSKETFQQTSTTFSNHHALCKPIRPSRKVINGLRYPLHPIFQNRIDINTWAIFNADLCEEIYHSADDCWKVALMALCPLCGLFFCYRERCELQKVIGHYNCVLFHPMLIDAQIFKETYGSGEDSYTITTVSFLVARDADHFRTFPRPVMGVSSGYLPLWSNSGAALVNLYVDPTPTVPARAPAQVPSFQTLHELSPGLVAAALVRFPVEDEKLPFSLLEYAGLVRARQAYRMAPDWVEFFEHRTDALPVTGAHGEPNPPPPQQQQQQQQNMPGFYSRVTPQHAYTAPLSGPNPQTYAAQPNTQKPNSSIVGAQHAVACKPSGARAGQIVPITKTMQR